MSRALVGAVVVLAVGVALAGCSQPGVGAVVSNPPAGRFSDVRCVSQDHRVTVTGTVRGSSGLTAFWGMSAIVYDARGHRIGSNSRSADIDMPDGFVRSGPQHFVVQVAVRGTPTECDLIWQTPGPSGPPGTDRLIAATSQAVVPPR